MGPLVGATILGPWGPQRVISLDAAARGEVGRAVPGLAVIAVDAEVRLTVAAVALLGGIAMTITALVLAASARAHRVASPH
jgi:hypothetical protein